MEQTCKTCTDGCCGWQGRDDFDCPDWTDDPLGLPLPKRKQEGPKMSVYQRIVEAYAKGNTYVNLSPEDVAILGSDLAIISMAETNSEARSHRCFSILSGMPRGAKAGRCVGDGWWLCPNCSRYKTGVLDQKLDSRHAEYNQKITDLIKEFSEHEATTAMDGVIHLLAKIFVRLDEL